MRYATFNTGTAIDTGDPLTKRALLFYEAPNGKSHKDSKGREHFVNEQYLQTLVDNTNSSLENGATIYLIQDHKKDDFTNVCGQLESNVYLKRIDEEDVAANPKVKSLLGKLGIFADNVKVTAQHLKNKIKEGIKFPNISVGLDMENMLIKEISTTVIPALANASLFHQGDFSDHNGTSALTMEEALHEKKGKHVERESVHDLVECFLDVVDNIRFLRDQDLRGGTRETYYQQAMNDLLSKIADLTDIGPDPGYASQSAVQDEINRQHTYAQEGGRPQIVGYSEDEVLAAFTMDDMEDAMSDFYRERRRRPGMIGTAARTAGGVGLAGAGLTGAGLAIRGGIKARQGFKQARKSGAGIGSSLRYGRRKFLQSGKSDVKSLYKGAKGLGKKGWKAGKKLLGL